VTMGILLLDAPFAKMSTLMISLSVVFFPLALFHTSVTNGPSAASRPSEP
jgi:hypothetical protein